MTVENRSMNERSVCQSPSVIGCQVLCQCKSPRGLLQAGVPMFDPNVNKCEKPWKNFTYQGSALAIASCVNAGSESMNARRGIRVYSSRQNHEPPERLRNRSASAAKARTVSALWP